MRCTDMARRWFGRRWRVELLLAVVSAGAALAVAAWLALGGIAPKEMPLAFVVVGVVVMLVSRMLRQVDCAEALIEARAQSVSMLQTVIDAIPAPVFIKDETFTYRGCNAQFEDFIGRPYDKIVGATVHDVAPRELAEIYDRADRALFAEGGAQTYECRVRDGRGEDRHVLFHKAVIQAADGRKAGIIGVMLDISERHALEEKLRDLSSKDPLTGLANRVEFARRLSETLARANRTGTSFTVVFLDLDGFKPVNDSLGHQAGDRLLRIVAERLRGLLRETDLVARMGGDEFTLILERTGSTDAAEIVAAKILAAIAEPVGLNGARVTVSASLGLAIYPDAADTAEDLIRQADQAMYCAKAAGRNRYSVAGPQVSEGIIPDVGL